MKTTHQIARELLALPDIPLLIEGWYRMDHHEMAASITDYDPNRAILWQKPDSSLLPVEHPGSTWRWLNINPTTK